MYKFDQPLIRRAWRTAHACACAIRRHLADSPLVSARALKACHVGDRMSRYHISNTRCFSSVVIQEDGGSALVAEDMTSIYQEIMDMLGRNIINKEMHTIATQYYRDLGDNNCGVGTFVLILLVKALNCHVFNDGTLKKNQIKLIAILQTILSTTLIRDDIIDNAKTRREMPTVHSLWDPYKVIMTGNMVLATCFGEAAKLGPSIIASVCQLHEITQRGQFLAVKEVLEDGINDLIDHYLLRVDLKFAQLVRYSLIALARNVGASVSIEETLSCFGHNFGNAMALLDDVCDVEDDLRNGFVTGPVIFATREHPVLKEMIMRKFAEKGDVEKALELVKNSQGYDETSIIAKRHFKYALGHLNLLANSPYKKAAETAVKMYMMKIDTRHLEREFDI